MSVVTQDESGSVWGGMYAVLNPRLLVVGSPNDSTRSAKHDASDHYSDFVQVDPVVSEF
ncbi:MAG: hypothetical protein RL015_142 [Verrucomicrobiota bacterium]|jgi:hypothetical protein